MLKSKFFKRIKNSINKSINIKYILWIVFSLLMSVLIGLLVVQITKPAHFLRVYHVSYEKERYSLENQSLEFINDLYSSNNDRDEFIKSNLSKLKEANAYVIDKNGEVKYKSESRNDSFASIESINIDKFREKMNSSKDDEFYRIYPMPLDSEVYYLAVTKKLEGVYTYTGEINYAIAGVVAFLLFIFLIYFGIRKKVKYIEYISSSIQEISKGNLNYVLELQGKDELALVANEINIMEDSLLKKIDKERENDKVQRELITNISHDLKTPLTIILGYLDIVRTNQYKTDDERNKYIETTYEKAVMLQKMVLNLFDLVKLSYKETALNKTSVDINKLLQQIITEFFPIAQGKNIDIEYIDADKTIMLDVDLEKIFRVFNNLMNNAMKYSEENEKVIVSLEEANDGAVITFKNKCKNINEEDLDNLFNRFYRGDKARNSQVEGSGIGLAIAKKIVELHNGNIYAELHGEQVYFIVRLRG